MTYLVKTGFDQALIDLVAISPQPRSPGIQYVDMFTAASGAVNAQGPYVPLMFNVLGNAADYLAILTQFGLHNARNANVTVYVRDERWAWVRKNGVALLPDIGREATWERYFPRDITIIVRNLENAA